MEKENRIVERRIEEKIYCHEYDSLVREMAKSMEVDEAKIYPTTEGEFNYEDINSWISAVGYKDNKSPDIEFSISSDKGKSKVSFETLKMEGVKQSDKETTKEELLYSMALTEAKMKVVKEIAEDTYPAVSYQIEDYRKQMEQVREEVLNNKRDTDTLDEILNRVVSRRGMLVATGLVISSLILSSCGIGTQPVEGYVPTSTRPNKATATEVFTKPLSTKTAEPTATTTPTKTATATEVMTPTETEIPLLKVKTTWNEGETAEDFPKCALEDIESGLYAKSVWKEVEKMPGFSEKVWPSLYATFPMKAYNYKTLVLGGVIEGVYDNSIEARPFRGVAVCVTEIDGKSVVVITFQGINPVVTDVIGLDYKDNKKFFVADGSSGLINVGLENDEDMVTMEWFRKVFLSQHGANFVYDVRQGAVSGYWKPNTGEGNDFNKEQTLISYIEKHREEILTAVDDFMNTGKMNLENYIFSFIMDKRAY